MLDDESFITRSKHTPVNFTRSRVLTFRTVAVLLMAKGSRSLQLSRNEFLPKLSTAASTVSKVAYRKARRTLKHTAFIELNRTAALVTPVVTTHDRLLESGIAYATFKGFSSVEDAVARGGKSNLPQRYELLQSRLEERRNATSITA